MPGVGSASLNPDNQFIFVVSHCPFNKTDKCDIGPYFKNSKVFFILCHRISSKDRLVS